MIYAYRCACGKVSEVSRSVREHTSTLVCECGGTAKQVFFPPKVIADIAPYRSMVTGERIKGRSHHVQHLRQHGLIEVGNERVERKWQELPSVVPDIKRVYEELS